MVNGYVNIPEAIKDIASFAVPKKLPGIFTEMDNKYKLGKPFFGSFIYAGTEAIFMPTVVRLQSSYGISFNALGVSVTIEVSDDDTVKLAAAG